MILDKFNWFTLDESCDESVKKDLYVDAVRLIIVKAIIPNDLVVI